MTEEYRYWRRNRVKIDRDVSQWNERQGFDEYNLLAELEEGDTVVEIARYQGLVDHTYAELKPDPDKGDVLSENIFEFFFTEITDEDELGLLLLTLT